MLKIAQRNLTTKYNINRKELKQRNRVREKAFEELNH